MNQNGADHSAMRRRWLLVCLFLLHVVPFAVRPALIGGDEPHYALMAHSIAIDGDLELRDNYDEVEEGSPAAGRKRAGEDLDRHLRLVNGKTVFSHPIGLPLLSAPLLAVQNVIAPESPPDLVLGLFTTVVTFAAFRSLWAVIELWSGNARVAAFVSMSAWFGTPAWFYGRVFMTEGFILASGIFAVHNLVRGRTAAAVVFLTAALLLKETGAIIVLGIIVGTAMLAGWRRAVPLCLAPAAWGAFFTTKNLLTVGTPFSTFQRYEIGDPLDGIAGLLISGDHGVLWFGSVSLIGFAGWLIGWSQRRFQRISAAAVGTCLLWFLVAAAWVDWRGGSSYGPRLVVPVLPLAAAGLVPLISILRAPVLRLIGVLIVFSFTVNLAAAFDPFTAFWEATALDLLRKNPAVLVIGPVLGWMTVRWFLRNGAEAEGSGSTV